MTCTLVWSLTPPAQADITVSALPMDNSRASDFGLMKARAPARACSTPARG